MTTIFAEMIADSVNEVGDRLTTLRLVYPRWIHSEFMTHRVFSRNASSSRAIPVERQIEMIEKDLAVPLFWGKNQKGMQAKEEFTGMERFLAEEAWIEAADWAIKFAKKFAEAGHHKQNVNRLLEPFSHIRVVVSATEWDNFFKLRIHKDAEPHMRLLAEKIKEAMTNSSPIILKKEQWHMPFILPEDRLEADRVLRNSTEEFKNLTLCKVAVARCARVSYETHDKKKPTIEEDVKLHDFLMTSDPIHASPAEHVAYADPCLYPAMEDTLHQANFVGFCQYRKVVEGMRDE